jgi:hypothetical protein
MSVTDWLLEGDPAIRWQVLRDLQNDPPKGIAAERARVEREGGAPRARARGPTGFGRRRLLSGVLQRR